MYDPIHNEMVDDSKKEEVESLLNVVVEALENDPVCAASYVNEFGDFSIAIPLGGDSEVLNAFIEKQELLQHLAGIAECFTECIRERGDQEITCCFVGFDRREASWIAENDERAHRLKSTLKSLVDSLGIQGVSCYLIEGPFDCDSVLAEVIQESNTYLEASKEWEGVPADWAPVEIEEIPSSPEAVDLLIDRADIVVALANGDDSFVEEMHESSVLKALCNPAMLEKPAIVFWTSWFETDWPVIDKIGVLLPEDMMLKLVDERSK